MNASANWGAETISTMIALVEASTTDSPAADVAKQLYLDELRDDLATILASLESDLAWCTLPTCEHIP